MGVSRPLQLVLLYAEDPQPYSVFLGIMNFSPCLCHNLFWSLKFMTIEEGKKVHGPVKIKLGLAAPLPLRHKGPV